jgi:hypothetical protein
MSGLIEWIARKAGALIRSQDRGDPLPLVFGTGPVDGVFVFTNNVHHHDWNWSISTPVGTRYIEGFLVAAEVALCHGPVNGVGTIWVNGQSKGPTGAAVTLAGLRGRYESIELVNGDIGQAHWSYLDSFEAKKRVGLSGTAYVRGTGIIMPDAKVPKLRFEVYGIGGSAGQPDAHPADVATWLLTDPDYGLGLDPSIVQTDEGPDGLAASSFRRYCDATCYRVSAVLSSQTTALEVLRNLLTSTNSTAVWTGEKVKIVPLCDTQFSKNGYTFTPPAAFALGPDDFAVSSPTDDPVEVERTSPADCFNIIPVEFTSRAAKYEAVTVESPVGAQANEEGARRGDTFSSLWITNADHAMEVSNFLARRSVYVRNQYKFKVSHKAALLEPGDLVSLTEPKLGLQSALARVVKIEEDAQGLATFVAEECPEGSATVISLSTQTADGVDSDPVATFATETATTMADDAQEAAITAQDTADDAQLAADDAQATADAALTLAGSKTKVTHAATPPGSPATGDLWFSTDTSTNCPDNNCKGHTADANGDPQVGAYPHRSPYWAHRWDGSAWVDADGAKLVIASEIAAGAIVADKIAAGAISASKISAGSITTNAIYAAYGDNLFPNGNSETEPPTGAPQDVLDSTEFVQRTTTDPYQGTKHRYVRGGYQGGGTFYYHLLSSVAAVPGESFHFEAMAKVVAADGHVQLVIEAQRTNGAITATALSSEAGSGSYSRLSCGLVVPADTVTVRFRIVSWRDTQWTDPITVGYVDNIVALRRVTTDLITPAAVTLDKLAANLGARVIVDVTNSTPDTVSLVGTGRNATATLVTINQTGLPANLQCLRLNFGTALPDTDYTAKVTHEHVAGWSGSDAHAFLYDIVERTNGYVTLAKSAYSSTSGYTYYHFADRNTRLHVAVTR